MGTIRLSLLRRFALQAGSLAARSILPPPHEDLGPADPVKGAARRYAMRLRRTLDRAGGA